MAEFKMRENDTLPKIRAVLSDADGAIDLTDAATITFHMNVAKGGTPKVAGAAVVVGSPAAGTVEYQWVTGDTDTPGTFWCEWQITFADGNILTVPNDTWDKVIITSDLESELDT